MDRRIGTLALLAALAAPTAGAQSTLERTPNLSGGWVATPGTLFLTFPQRFAREAGRGIEASPTFAAALALPSELLAGARFEPHSALARDEWEVFARWAPWGQYRGRPVDLAATAAYNGGATSVDAEVTAARWFGPLRAIAAARLLGDPPGIGAGRVVMAGGGVFHPAPGSLPIALAADVATPVDGGTFGDDVAWSAGVQVGLSFTDHTLSVFATNTGSSTLEGSSRGGPVRLGLELTVPVPAGRFLGWYLPREQAAEAVVAEPAGEGRVVRAEASRYLFLPRVLEVEAGTTIEWTNTDRVVHTVSADDGTWDSGAIRPGARWSARFDRPGRYPFHCGPHPFMRGMVVVR